MDLDFLNAVINEVAGKDKSMPVARHFRTIFILGRLNHLGPQVSDLWLYREVRQH